MESRWRVAAVIALVAQAFLWEVSLAQLVTDTQDYAVLVERSSNRKFFNSYGLQEGNAGRGSSTLMRLKAWQGFSQASFEWNISKLRSSGPVITSKLFVAGGVVWTLWLDLESNSTRARLQGRDAVGLMLAASWAAAWHEEESVAVSVRVALPNAEWDLSSGVSVPVHAAAVPPDVGAVLTRGASGMWVADLNRDLLERGLLGASEDDLLLRVHLLNVTVRWREDGMHPEARYSRAVRQQVSAVLGADSYGVRHEFETAVHTSVVDVGLEDGIGAETHSQYHWGEMSYNSSVVGELLWYMVLDNLRCHGLGDEEAQGKIDAVVAMCDIIVGRVTSHPRVYVTVSELTGAVQYLDENGEDLRLYGQPCRSPHAAAVAAGAAAGGARGGGSDIARAPRGGGAGGAAGYADFQDVYDNDSDGDTFTAWWADAVAGRSGTKARRRRRRPFSAVLSTLLGLIFRGSSTDGAASSSTDGAAVVSGGGSGGGSGCRTGSTSSAADAADDVTRARPGNGPTLWHQHTQPEGQPDSRHGDSGAALPWPLPERTGSGGGGSSGRSGGEEVKSFGATLQVRLRGILRWVLGHEDPPQQQQQQQHSEYDPYGYDEEDEEPYEDELVPSTMEVALTVLVQSSLVLIFAVMGSKFLNRLYKRRYGPRRDRVRREHAPASLVGAVAAAAAAAAAAGSSSSSSAGAGGSGAAKGGTIGRGSTPTGGATPVATSAQQVQPTRQQVRSRRTASGGGAVSSAGSSSSISGSSNSSGGGATASCNVASVTCSASNHATSSNGGSQASTDKSSVVASPALPPQPPRKKAAAAAAAPARVPRGDQRDDAAEGCTGAESGGVSRRGSVLAAFSWLLPWRRGPATASAAATAPPPAPLPDAMPVRSHSHSLSVSAAGQDCTTQPIPPSSGHATAASASQVQEASLKQPPPPTQHQHQQRVQQQQRQPAAKQADRQPHQQPLPPLPPSPPPSSSSSSLPSPSPATTAHGRPQQQQHHQQQRSVQGGRRSEVTTQAPASSAPMPPAAVGLAAASAPQPAISGPERARAVARPAGLQPVPGAAGSEVAAGSLAASAPARGSQHRPQQPGASPTGAFAGPAAAQAAAIALSAGAAAAAAAPQPPPASADCTTWSHRDAATGSAPIAMPPSQLPLQPPQEASLCGGAGSVVASILPPRGSEPAGGGGACGFEVAAEAPSAPSTSAPSCPNSSGRSSKAASLLSSSVSVGGSSSTSSSTAGFGTPSLASSSSLPAVASTPIGGVSSSSSSIPAWDSATGGRGRGGSSGGGAAADGCGWQPGCGSGCVVTAAAAAAAAAAQSRRPLPKQPWSIELLAEMAGSSDWRRRSCFEPASPGDFACLRCRDAPRECGFLHGATVHMGLCGECAGLLAGPAHTGCMTCMVCHLPYDKLVEVVQ